MTERKTDIGPPHYEQFLPPVIKNNYGKWKYHEIVKPGANLNPADASYGADTLQPSRRRR